ncbi:MAG TPA: iron ABC transporter permease [Trueperaceae bacterium]|nr:iron ABC transporter permease [Trueperaceae bacterium]
MRRSGLSVLTGGLAIVFLTASLFVPLGAILWRGIAPEDAALGTGLVDAVRDPYYLGRLWFTTWQALLSTVLTVAIGLPSALLLARYRFSGRRLLTAAFTVPFVMPTVVAGMGFLALAGPRGVLGVDLRNTIVIVLAAHVFYNFAIVARLVSGFLENAGPRLEQAAATLGAGAWRTVWRVTLPLALPATVAAATLVFIFCFTSFGVILILAPDARFATLEVELYRLTLRLLRLDTAAALALVQLVVVGGLGLLYSALQARLAVPIASGRAHQRRPRGLGAVLLGGDLVLIGAVVLAPLVALGVQGLTAPDGSFPSAVNLQAMFGGTRSVGFATLGLSLRNSLTFASLSTVAALVVGLAFAYAVVRGRLRWLDGLSLLPLATSPVTLGLGYLITYPWLVATFWGVPLAHSLIAFPFVTRTLLPALRALPPSQAGAAATLGAGPLRTLIRIELPQLLPSLAVAAAFAFAVSLGEFGASLLLVRPEHATLPVAIFDRLGRPGALNYGAALGLSLVLMVVTALIMLVLQRRGRSEF